MSIFKHQCLQIEAGDDKSKGVVFFKTKPQTITPENVRSCVFVSTLSESPVSSLFHSVQKVSAELLGIFLHSSYFIGVCTCYTKRREDKSLL